MVIEMNKKKREVADRRVYPLKREEQIRCESF